MCIKQSRSQQEERKDWGSFLPSFDKVKYHGPERPFRAVELYTLLAGDVREQTLSPTIYLKVCHGPEQTFWVVKKKLNGRMESESIRPLKLYFKLNHGFVSQAWCNFSFACMPWFGCSQTKPYMHYVVHDVYELVQNAPK